MNEGWIKVFRKIKDWEWFSDSDTFKIFIYLVMEANHKPKKWHGVDVMRGQVITGRKRIALDCHLGEMVVRTSLDRLKSTNEITIQTTNRFSIITICNYDTYQSIDDQINQPNNQPSNQQITNKQPTDNQQITTTKNDKNNKNDKNKDCAGALSPKFVKPSIDEIKEYCAQANLQIDPDGFSDSMESCGWVLKNKQPVKDWKATIRVWNRNEIKWGADSGKKKDSYDDVMKKAAVLAEVRAKRDAERQENKILSGAVK